MIIRKKRNLFLNEVDVDGQPAGEEGAEDTDYTSSNNEGGEVPPTDNSAPEAGDTPAADADGGDPTNGEGDIDYTQGGDDPGMEGGEGGGDEGGGAPPDDNQATADDARGMEEELFKDLTPDQIDLKHRELKNNFLSLYDSTSNIVDRINQVPTSDDTVASITFVAKKLADIRKMIADYMNDVYSTKSYMENAINYNRFLAALNGINKILDEINKQLTDNDPNEANR